MLERLNMLDKMRASRFVKKYSVQFVNASGKLSAPFYFWDNKPHECSQTWQVVRSEFDKMMLDNAREHGVEAHEGVRVLEVLFDGERAVGVKIQTEDGQQQEVRAKVVVDASGQSCMLQNRFKLRLWDPQLNKGAIWTYWEGAYRDEGKDEGATVVLQTADKQGLVLEHPACRRHRQRRRGRAVRLSVQRPRQPRADLPRRSRTLSRSEAAHRRGEARGRLLRHQGLLVSRQPAGRRRLGAGGRRLRLSRSALLVRRAAGAEVGPTRRRRDRRRAEGERPLRRAPRHWGPMFNQGIDRMRRLVCEYYAGFSFGRFIREYPHLTGTVTDLLIGDLFTDKVDKVWGPMESTYEEGKGPPPMWDSGTPPEIASNKLNELFLPEGYKP